MTRGRFERGNQAGTSGVVDVPMGGPMTDLNARVCPLARRRLLLGAGAAGLGALLAACGADPTTGPRTPAGPGGSAPSSAAPDPGELPTGGPGLPEGALVETKDVPVGGGIVTDQDVLVVQPRTGVFHAYEAQCPHENVLVNPPDQAGVITCPGHLSYFRAADGSRIDGPAPRGLTTLDVHVVDGYVVER